MRLVLNMGSGIAALLLAASAAASEESQGSPAFLVRPKAETRHELAVAVVAELGGLPVTLADDALTRSSELALGRVALSDTEGHPAGGREPGRPELFRLFLIDRKCVLVHERTGHRTILSTAHCTSVRPPS
jgi:hypothetical protein